MELTISGYSTALFSSWFFIEELSLLFDAGDGVVAGLMQKSRKVKHVFISHADRDHLTGLPQFVQLNARGDYPIIYYPKDSGSFPALQKFLQLFDSHLDHNPWKPIVANEKIWIRKDMYVLPNLNSHIARVDGMNKSFGFKVFQTRKKLREEFTTLTKEELVKIKSEIGAENLTYEIEENIFSYSGDTPAENFDYWDGSHVLIHESTFLSLDEELKKDPRTDRHCLLEEVIKGLAGKSIGKLILCHFSTRYSQEEIDSAIEQLIKKYKIDFPVYRILPGTTIFDIFDTRKSKPEL